MTDPENTIRVFIISDDYRWHYHTTDPDSLYETLGSYVKTLALSQKENTYHLSSTFMDKKEYAIIKKNYKRASKKADLKLVPEDTDAPKQ